MRGSKTYEMLKTIPVFPKGVFLGEHNACAFAVNAPLCEEDGYISFVSEEAKDEYIENFK